MRHLILAALLLPAARSSGAAESNPPAAANPVVLFVGDSLTAGYGVEPEEAWPAVLGASWEKRGLSWRARDAAVSGATSAGLKEQVAWALTPDVKLVFICMGANDGLRGLPIGPMKKNIADVIKNLQKRGVRVALAGMKMPPNFGEKRARAFENAFSKIARERRVPFMPFLLEGVAADPALNQADGIHPNAQGHKIIAASVGAFLDKEGLLK